MHSSFQFTQPTLYKFTLDVLHKHPFFCLTFFGIGGGVGYGGSRYLEGYYKPFQDSHWGYLCSAACFILMGILLLTLHTSAMYHSKVLPKNLIISEREGLRGPGFLQYGNHSNSSDESKDLRFVLNSSPIPEDRNKKSDLH